MYGIVKKTLIVAGVSLLFPLVVFATASSVDRITDHIEPLIKTDYIKGQYFVASSTTVASTLPYASTTAISSSKLTSGNCVQASTGGLLTTVSGACGTGTVTAITVNTSNGFAGSSSGGATPALTLTTTISGVLKGNGTAISAAANGTDYTLITAKTCNAGDFMSAVTAAGVFTCTTPAGTTYTGTYPINVTGSVISFQGLATTSPFVIGQVAYVNANNRLTSAATGTVSNGTGISVTAGQSVIGSGLTITNTAPDQTVVLSNGTGINTTGTYPNFTIANTGVISNSCPGGFLSCSGTNPSSFTLGTLGVANGGTGSTTLGGLLSGNGTSVYSSPTTTATCSGSASCSAFTVIGSTPVVISASGSSGSAFPFTPFTNYNATSTPLGLLNGYFSTASSTQSGSFNLPSLAAGTLNVAPTTGLTYTTATTSITNGTGIIFSGTAGALMGGSNLTINCATANGTTQGCLTASDWLNFNNKIGTSSVLVNGQVLVAGPNGNTAYSVATGTVSNGTGISVTAGQSIIGSGLTITNTGVTSLTAGTNISLNAASGAVIVTGIGYPFIGDATSTRLTFKGGIIAFDATTTNLYASSTLGAANARFGATATTTFDSAGNEVIPSGSNLTITGKADGCATFASGVLNSIGSPCGSSGSSFAFPFTATTYGGNPANATSTLLVLNAGTVMSTSSIGNLTAGTVTATSSLTLPQITSKTLNTDQNGLVYGTGTSTPTATAPITYSGTLGQFIGGVSGAFDCTAASGTVKGCLAAADWLTFNNKIGTSSILTNGQVLAAGPGGNTAYSVATSSVTNGTGISFTGTAGALVGGTSLTITNTGVTSLVAGTNISISGSTGAVTITGTGYPFPNNATTTLLSFNGNASTTALSVTQKAFFGATATTTIDSTGNIVIPSGSNLTVTGKTDGCATFATGVLNSTGSACGSGGSGTSDKWATSTAPILGIYPNGGTSVAVGIGTTTPGNYNLTLASSTGPQLALTDGSATDEQYSWRAMSGVLGLSTTSPQTFASTTSSNIFNITKAGRISIGMGATTNPTATLQLYDQNGTGPSQIFGGNVGGDTDYWLARVSNNDGVDNDFFQIGRDLTPGTTPYLTLTNTGKFGVGSSTPYALLSVDAPAGTTPYFSIGSTTGEVLKVVPSGTPGLIVGTTTSNWLVDLFSGTQAQLALSYSASSHWLFNNIAGNLFFASSTGGTATSTFADPNIGPIQFPANGGCIGCTDIVINGGINLRNGKYVGATTTALTANAYQDVYTAPTGRRALFVGWTSINNTAGTVNMRNFIKISGTYYFLNSTSSISTTGGGGNIILEPGESFSVLSDTTTSLVVFRANFLEYDASVPFKSARVFNPGGGTTTLYTVPTGVSASWMGSQPLGGATTAGGTVAMTITNDSGTSPTMFNFVVPSGSTANNKTNGSVSAAVTTNFTTAFSFGSNTFFPGIYLNSGDSLQFSLTAAIPSRTFVWANVYEH